MKNLLTMSISRGLVEMQHRIQTIQYSLNDLIIEIGKLGKEAGALEKYLSEYDVPKNQKADKQSTK